MIAAISLMRKRADITADAFRRHWLDPHGVMTAELPGLRRYWQNHCIMEHPATNTVARTLDVLGFPVLWFDSIEQRQIANTSPRMLACNVDPEAFVGSVSRLATEPTETVRPHRVNGTAKAFVLATGVVDPAWPAAFAERALACPGVVNLVTHRIIEQAAPPQSLITALALPVAGIAEVTFASEAALAASAAALVMRAGDALFVVEEYKLK